MRNNTLSSRRDKLPNNISVYSYVRRNNTKNFGDDLSLPMCEHASGRSFVWGSKLQADMYAVGSLLQVFKSRKYRIRSMVERMLNGKRPLVIWGTGVIDTTPLHLPRLEILAVRGPLTAKAVECH